MKLLKFYAAFFLLYVGMGTSLALAQDTPPIIILKEESTTGKYMDTIPAMGPAIVDVNSIIHLRLDLAALEEEMFRYQGVKGSDARLKELNALNKVLRNQNEILELINRKFRGSKQPVLKDYQDLAEQSNYLLTGLQENLSDEIYEELTSPEMEDQFSSFEGPYIVFVINFLEGKAEQLRKSLLADVSVDGKVDSSLMIYFRLGAFIKNKNGGRPVHVENFDNISTDAYIELSRFSPPVSDAQKTALIQTKLLNDSIQENTAQATAFFRNVVKAKVNQLFPSDSSKVKLKTAYSSSLAVLNKKAETKPAAQVLLENELNLNKVEQFYTLATDTYRKFADNFPQGIFQEYRDNNFDTIFDEFEQLVINSYEALNGDITLYQQTPTTFRSGGENPGLERLQEVDHSYSDYVNATKKDISAIQTIFTDVKNMLNPFRKSSIKNEAFTEQITRFTAGRIPATGYIELKSIGERNAGDEILIKATLERGRNRGNPNFEQKEVFRRYITMERIAIHIRMSGSVILANPYNRGNNDKITLTNRFQFAPNYGIFLKWGSRKSRFYNDFLSFGLGLGFSSPDFNLDGTPEFGAGIISTALKDLFSVGWGWNFGVDAPYVFMGFNIPFTIGGLQSATPGF